jgi:hypothetical protein
VKEESKGEKSKEMRFVFLDGSNVLFGTPGKIKAGIDVAKGKGKDAFSTGRTKDFLKKIDTSSIFWMMLGNIPEDVKQKASSGGLMQLDLSKAEGLVGAFDFKNGALSGNIQLFNANEQANKQIADTLNGFKGMGAMFAQQDPDLGQVLNALSISAGADGVKLSISVPEALMNKMAEKAKAKAQSMVQPAVTEEPKSEEQAKTEKN